MIAKEDLRKGMMVIVTKKTNPNPGTTFKSWLDSYATDGRPIAQVNGLNLKPNKGDVVLVKVGYTGPGIGGCYFMCDDLEYWNENSEWFWTQKLKKDGMLL